MPPSIYLASQSPRRQSLLSQMGQSFVLLLPDTSEDVESLESWAQKYWANHQIASKRVTCCAL